MHIVHGRPRSAYTDPVPWSTKPASPYPPGTQTLVRGLDVLEFVAQSRDGVTVQQAADHVGVHRTMAMRALAALGDRNLIRKSPDGRFRIAAGVIALAREYQPALRDAARPILERLADTLQASACLFAADGDAAVAFLVIEPEASPFHLTFKPGSRHPLDQGSAGIAIASLRPPSDADPEQIIAARLNGYARSHGEVEPGAWGVSVPIETSVTGVEACVHVTTFHEEVADRAVPLVAGAAQELERLLRGPEV